MNEPSAAEIVARTRPRRRRWLTVLLSLVLLFSGAAIGSGLTLLVIVRGVQFRLQHPEQFPVRATHRLKSFLQLSDSQAQQVETILRRHQGELQGIRREVQPRIDTQLNEIRNEIAEVLTPQQATRWQRWLEEKRRLWLPPMPASSEGS